MPSVLRSVAAFSLVCAFTVLSAPGCSQQGQGERCDKAANGDADCDSGLTCVKRSDLLEGITDRCCPVEGSESDTRCTRGVPGGNGGSSGSGSSAEAGASGEATSSGGSAGSAGSASGATNGVGGDSAGAPSNAGAPSVTSDGGAAGAPLSSPSSAGQGGAP